MQQQTTNKVVLIGIQARSTSTRFPGKIFEMIGEKMVIEHVIDAAKSARDYLQRFVKHINIQCHVVVLYPFGDKKILDVKSSGVSFMEGDEQDVLSRYIRAAKAFNADYTIRLTSDCPMIMDFIINKHIRCAIFNELDYVSNIEEECRTVADGFDCECISKRAMDWLEIHAVKDFDREHVTTLIRSEKPKELLQGFILSKLDTTNMKLSLDTLNDLNVMRKYYHQREHKLEVARKIFGQRYIYEL